jgi:hypothetical protein
VATILLLLSNHQNKAFPQVYKLYPLVGAYFNQIAIQKK